MDTALEIPTSVPSVIPRPVPPELRDEAEVEALGERIAHLSALLTATEYQLLMLIREFDQRYGWRGGFRSCAHWLNWRTGRSSIDSPGGRLVHLDRSGCSPTTLDGIGNVSAETSRRIACDSSLLLMTHDETGRTLDVGRRTRVISPALRRALDHRDGGCRFPGCGIKHTDAHHLTHWADGGETKLDNLVLLCRMHHRCVHEEGYAVDLDETGAVRFQDPWGTVLPQAPPLPDLAEVPASSEAASALLAGLLDEHGITLDPKAGMPDWDGRPLDLAWALDVLMN